MFCPAFGFLVFKTHENLERQIFLSYRTASEQGAQLAADRIRSILRSEENRPFEEYRYIYRSADALGRKGDWRLSSLSKFPVESDVTGILGYFQIEPDRKFATPILPESGPLTVVALPHRSEREAVREQLFSVVTASLLQTEKTEVQTMGPDISELTDLSFVSKFIDSHVLRSLPTKRFAEQPDDLSGINLPGSKSAFPGEAGAGRHAQPAKSERRDIGKNSPAAEVDPFRATAEGDDWLVFHRKVWTGKGRLIQGIEA